MRILILAVLSGLLPAWAAAQSIEVGGTIAAGCVGSDGSACGTGTYPMPAAHVSWWAADTLELSGRVARIGLPSRRFEMAVPAPSELEITHRSRQFLSAMALYHFKPDWAVRPFVGAGLGVIRSHMRVRCEPGPCAGIPGTPPEGATTRRMMDVVLALGLSGGYAERWTWRAGCLSHRFANDSNSVMELLVGVGYRFRGSSELRGSTTNPE